MNIREHDNKQTLLFPPCIGDFLPEDDTVHIIDAIVDKLDLSCLYKKLSREGNPSYDPQMMLELLFYAYSQGVFGSRKIMNKLERDVGYIYLAGMQKPDFRTISDFRKNNLSELRELFSQIVSMCYKLGLISLNQVSIDGTVMRANASNSKSYDKKRIRKEMKKLKGKIEEYLKKGVEIDKQEDLKYGKEKRGDELPEELRGKQNRLKRLNKLLKDMKLKDESKKINMTDKDAVYQKDKQSIKVGYRGELAVDSKEQVIIGYDVTNEQVDNKQLIPMSKEILNNTQNFGKDKKRKKKIPVAADSGFSSGENLKETEKIKDINFYIPDSNYEGKRRGKKIDEDSPFHVSKFKYNKRKDEYICPAGKRLKFKKEKKEKNYNVRIYKHRFLQNEKAT